MGKNILEKALGFIYLFFNYYLTCNFVVLLLLCIYLYKRIGVEMHGYPNLSLILYSK